MDSIPLLHGKAIVHEDWSLLWLGIASMASHTRLASSPPIEGCSSSVALIVPLHFLQLDVAFLLLPIPRSDPKQRLPGKREQKTKVKLQLPLP